MDSSLILLFTQSILFGLKRNIIHHFHLLFLLLQLLPEGFRLLFFLTFFLLDRLLIDIAC